MNKLSILIVSGVSMLALSLVLALGTLSTYNQAASLKNLYEMKVKDNSSEFDNMWKKISQVCQIADSKKNGFKEIFTAWAEARTPKEAGKMMLWLQESAPPNLDLGVYDKAQNIIVASRDSWTMRQKELVGIASEYNNMLVTQPRGLILGVFGFKHIDPQVITSTRTEEVFKTGKDDNVNLK